MQDKKPTLYFHVYGDFILYAKQWEKISSSLKNFKVRFICASEKQASLVQRFIKNKNNIVSLCPFPVDETKFHFNQPLRQKVRKKLAPNNEHLILYTGRLSQQKNTLEIIDHFSLFIQKTQANAKCLFAGEFDDMGTPYIGKKSSPFEYRYRFYKKLNRLPASIRDKIVYLGNLSDQSLLELYNASDFFISLSVHNDEDFGMSPAEALMTGLPCLLTNWGGYSSFQSNKFKQACLLTQTQITKNKIDYERHFTTKLMIKMFMQENPNHLRKNISEHYIERYSINPVSSIVQSFLKTPNENFEGFNKKLGQVAEKDFSSKQTPFLKIKSTKQYSPLYRELYESYIN